MDPVVEPSELKAGNGELKESNHETHAAIAIAVALVTQLGGLTGVPFYSVLAAIVALVAIVITARLYMKKKKIESGQPVSDEPLVNIDKIIKDITVAVITEMSKEKESPPKAISEAIPLKKK